MKVPGKKALITGGSRGIGRETALRLAAAGVEHMVIGYCMNREAALQTVAEVELTGAKCTALATDVASEESFRDFFTRVAAETGEIDIFVSNAARASFQPLSSMTMRTWQRVVDLNATAFLLGSQLAADLMPRGGRIVGVSSLGSQYCFPGYGALGSAKAMMESTARYLAVELAQRGINVNVVCGGMIDTDSTRALPNYAAIAEGVARGTPTGRVGKPEDLARVITFLCSEDADWIRGQTLIADGGYSLGLGAANAG